MTESLAQFFLTNFQAHHSERAYGQPRGYRMEWFTYGQVLDMALRFGQDLRTRGICRGDRVVLWGENCAQWVSAFFGCALQGVVAVPMDDAGTLGFVSRVSQQVDAKLWICSQRHSEEAAAGPPMVAFDNLAALPTHHSATSTVPMHRDDTLEIVFTSGTTADPKGVVITHGNVLANIAPLEREMQPYLKYECWVHPLRFLNLLPLSHVFGQFLAMFLPPLLGGTVIFQQELKPSAIIRTVRRERVSVLVSVPRVLQSLKQKVELDLEAAGKLEGFREKFLTSRDKHFLHRWWIFRDIHRHLGWKFWALISGGATLDNETEEFWGRLGYAAIQGYGLTETTSLISVNHPFKLGKGSIGKVLPGREVKLADDGEILIRGEGVASGYWKSGSQERAADDQGWYHTGDIGALDSAGNLYFKGRKKEVIVTPAGLNVYPEDLEAALRRQPEIRDCLVVGIERDGNAEPCAVLIARDSASLEPAVERANQSLAEFQRMRMWVQWPDEDFPRTGTQKPRRNLIRDFADQRISHTGAQSTRKKPADSSSVAELISRITGKSPSSVQSGLNSDTRSDLGLSSLDRVELLSALEDRYQVDLSETRFTAARTVGDIERMLRGQNMQQAGYHYPAWVLRWPVTWVRWVAHYLLMRPAVLVLGWPRIEGRENLREYPGPLLVVCNHIDDIDVGFVQTALTARLRNRLATATGGEALEALRSPADSRGFFGKFYDRLQWVLGVSLLNLFPLPREAGFRQSFAYAGEAVDRGYSILVFPEGHHTTDGKLRPFRAGIGLLVNNLNIPVVPMRIVGLFELKQAGKKFAAPHAISVSIGKPVTFPPGAPPEQIASKLQRLVEAL